MEFLTDIRRHARRATCVLLTTVMLATLAVSVRPSFANASANPLLAAYSASSPVDQLLGRRFALPARERSVRVVKTLTLDLDADGDVDAVGATTTGNVVVWINIGQNRLERRTLKPPAPGKTRFSRPTAYPSHTLDLDTTDGRWAATQSRRLADTPRAMPPASARTTDATSTSLRFGLPPRAPPAALRSAL